MSKKRVLMEIILRLIILSIFFELITNTEKYIYIWSNKFNSKIHIIYIALFSIIASFKYIVLRVQFEKKRKISEMVIVILINMLLFMIGARLSISDYGISNWIHVSEPNQFKEFVNYMLLFNFIDTINFEEICVIDVIIAIIVVLMELCRRKNENKRTGYFIERCLKFIFKYSIIIIFFPCMLIISSKFILVKTLKDIIISIIVIGVIGVVIRFYIILKSFKGIFSYDKKNLIIVVNANNFKFSLEDSFIKNIKMFKKYEPTSLIKSLLIIGKKYVFVSYEAIRYNLINIEEYQNIAYLICLTGNSYQLNKNESEFSKFIDEIIKSNTKFMFYSRAVFDPNEENNITRRMKEKYSYKFIKRNDIKKVLDVVNSNKEIDVLKKKSIKALQYIEDAEKRKDDYLKKNSYLKYGLNLTINSFNYMEIFYTLLKLGEYLTHYMGLKDIIIGKGKIPKNSKDIKKGFLSVWRECISFDRKYYITNQRK